jgi:hypothetical protein
VVPNGAPPYHSRDAIIYLFVHPPACICIEQHGYKARGQDATLNIRLMISAVGDVMSKRALLRGLAAGTVGVIAMTLAERLEQHFTKRPNSYVPAHTLQRLVSKPDKDDLLHNWAMHWGQGILLGAVRGWMAEQGTADPLPRSSS